MKKVILFTAIVSLFAINNVKGQAGAAFGVKGGVNMNKLNTTTSGITSDPRLGPVAGLWVRAKVLGFFIQGEALYNTRGGKITTPANIFTATPSYETKVTTSYIDVPVLVGKSFFSLVRVNVGPNFQFLLNDVQKGSLESNYNSFVLGYQAGIGVDIKKIGIDLRYDSNISKVNSKVNSVQPGTIPFDISQRNSIFQLTVAYKLFGVLND